MKKAYFSRRIYKSKLEKSFVSALEQTLFTFNQAKHFAYQMQIKEKRLGKKLHIQSPHLVVKSEFNLNDYFANSAVQEANAIISSQEELKKLYMKEKEAKCKTIQKKIKQTKSRMTVLRKIKNSFIKGKPAFNKTSREQQKGRFFVVEFKNKTDLYYNEYDFEHLYLDKEINFLKAQLGKFEYRLDRIQKQIDSLKNKITSVVFGSKKLFKAKFTVENYQLDHELWKKHFDQKKYGHMTISGRKDAKYGNFVFSYDCVNKKLFIQLSNKQILTFENVTFPYGQKEIDRYFDMQLNCKDKKRYGSSIGWSVENHEEYFIFKCLIDIPENPHVNFSKQSGVVGIDCNVDHFAVSEINAKGQLVHSFVQHFDLFKKSSNQITKIIEAEVINIVDYATKANKPLVVEKLDTTISKGKNLYGSKKANLKMSMFAYRKMIEAIKSRSAKMGVAVFEVNPAYTSQIGKMKYMKRFGISIHQAASFVIARRAMGFKENLPPVLYSLLPEKIAGLYHWTHWKNVSNLLKGIRTCAFYQSELFDLAKFRASRELFVTGALTELEQKGLAKIKK